MDLFALFGRITINASDASDTISEITESAENLCGTLKGVGSSSDGVPKQIGANSKIRQASRRRARNNGEAVSAFLI